MDPVWQALFFAASLICLIIFAALEGFAAARFANRGWLFPLGVALFVFPFFWIALKAA